ncbi:MAG: hypothetical protein VX278_17540, partial [Myxococcota bacterium]|nr:hypothetical protein [Myxococcota bacterium]
MWWLWFACSGKIQDTEIQAYSCDARTDSFAVLDQATLTQIHADVASDGRQVWITYNLPNENGDFD